MHYLRQPTNPKRIAYVVLPVVFKALVESLFKRAGQQSYKVMYESVQLGESNHKEFMNHFPAVEIANKQYSLDADIITGWRPKNKILGPIPFNFDAALLDEIIDELTSFGSKYRERVIYLGHRFTSSFKMHQQLNRRYSFKYESSINSNFQHMAAYFRKFHANFKSKHSRIFRGMNPTLKDNSELTFDSNFESGNLDAVIKVADNQYDLYLRIDTNTRGHLQWFNFTVKNCAKTRVRFNIVNFKKAKTLYQRGMRPYVFSHYLKQTRDVGWVQSGENTRYSRRKLTYDFLSEYYDDDQITFNCLQFDHTFEVDWEEVHFAYSPPFTYSDLNDFVAKLKTSASSQLPKDKESFIKEEVLCESLSGLEIPLLTITDPEVDSKKKRCVLISGRIHPGESCSSFMGKGLLEYICSETEEAAFLRRNVVFKMVPMLNPDGVVVGNFRTSLCGRDLNRTFKLSNDLLIPEVRSLKELVGKLKGEFKNRLLMFLDLHGHSVKKNVFLYGPEYDIWETNYYKTRIFPKIISNKTDMFRYYSCLFRVSEAKKSTARAVILRNVPHCYTIQASTGFYFCPVEKKDVPFTPEKWTAMGRVIAESLREYIEMLNEEHSSKEERKQKLVSLKTVKNTRMQSKKNSDKLSLNKFQTRVITNSSQKNKPEESQERREEEGHVLSKKVRDLIESIKQDEKRQEDEKREDGHESDQFSEGGSDSESAADDVPEEQMRDFQDQMCSYMQEFKERFYREKAERQYSMKDPSKKKSKEAEELRGRKEQKGVELIASLRKKAEQLEKTRELVVWNRIKEEFKDIKSRSGGELFNPRTTLSRVEGIQSKPAKKMRRLGVESEILEKEELLLGFKEVKMGK